MKTASTLVAALGLLAGAVALILAAPCVTDGPALQAADATGASSAAKPASGQAPAKTAGQEREPQIGELFPGVKGISGAELAQRIAEQEKREQEAERQKPSNPAPAEPAAAPATPAGGAESTPAEPSSSASPATGGKEGTEETKEPAKSPPPVESAAKTASSAEKAGSLIAPAAYLKQLDSTADSLDDLLKKAKKVRANADTAIRRLGNESRIQYYLRWDQANAPQTAQAYVNALMLPIAVYRHIYERALEGLGFAVDKRPADLDQASAATADKSVARLKAARRDALLGAAELYTRMRNLDAAQKIYDLLTKDYPKDPAVQRSFAAFAWVHDQTQPDQPPSATAPTRRMGGGGGGRGHR